MNMAQVSAKYFHDNKYTLTRDGNYQVSDFMDWVDPNHVSEELYNETLDTSRWESNEFTVFKFPDGSMLGVEHSEGLTENQESTGVTDVYEVGRREVMTWDYFPFKVG